LVALLSLLNFNQISQDLAAPATTTVTTTTTTTTTVWCHKPRFESTTTIIIL